MSFLLSRGPGQDDTGHDGLDNLLRSFYKAEMPNPWPSMEAPADHRVLPAFTAPPRRRHSLVQSRLALAASVALLLAGTWLLIGGKESVATAPIGHELQPALGDPKADKGFRNPPPPVKNGDNHMPIKITEDWLN